LNASKLSNPSLIPFGAGAWLVVSCANVYCVTPSGARLLAPLTGLAVGTIVLVLAILLSRGNAVPLLRYSALIVGASTLLIAVMYNLVTCLTQWGPGLAAINMPLLDRPYFERLAMRFFVGITLGMFGVILILLSQRLRERAGVAWTVAFVVAVYYLLVGSLAGVAVTSYKHTWGPIWLSFGLWLLVALLRARPSTSASGPTQ